MNDIYQILSNLGIAYTKYEHPAVFTVEEAAQYDRGIDAGKTKNLFLRNKRGDEHYLVVIESTKSVDLKKLASLLDTSKLGFASAERMMKYLGLTPGSVSPLGLINDVTHAVTVVIDKELLSYKKLGFHPNTNTATIVIKTEDFKKFLEWTKERLFYMDI